MKDAKLYFSEVQALTSDEVSDKYLDVKTIAEVGRGSQLFINVDVCTAFASSLYSKLEIWLVSDTSAPTSVDAIAKIGVNLDAKSDAGELNSVGKKVKVPLPSLGLKDHIGLHYEVTGSGLATGAVNAYLTLG